MSLDDIPGESIWFPIKSFSVCSFSTFNTFNTFVHLVHLVYQGIAFLEVKEYSS